MYYGQDITQLYQDRTLIEPCIQLMEHPQIAVAHIDRRELADVTLEELAAHSTLSPTEGSEYRHVWVRVSWIVYDVTGKFFLSLHSAERNVMGRVSTFMCIPMAQPG